MERRLQHLDVGTAGDACKERTELGVVIPNEESRSLAIWRGFAELLGHPGIGGMTGHSDMHHFSALQFNDEESKERAEEEVGDGQEIAGPDLARMVMQEGRPRLRGGTHAPMSHVFLDRAF